VLLGKLAQIPVLTWNYKSQDPAIRHIGPTAQDFFAAFGVGEDERRISTIDADGVALAAIQALHQLNLEKDRQIERLTTENHDFRKLREEHRRYEQELVDLNGRGFLSPDQQWRVSELKKLKLIAKDRMEALLRHARAATHA